MKIQVASNLIIMKYIQEPDINPPATFPSSQAATVSNTFTWLVINYSFILFLGVLLLEADRKKNYERLK